MVKKENDYWADSIKVLSPREAVRTKPWMYIGNTNMSWLTHLVYELLSNSIDEVINGFWDKIIVRLIDKETIEIEDFWRWIPFWISKKLKKEVLELNLSTLHAWWKTDNTTWDSAYQASWGTNGVWISIVNFLSKKMYIHSWKKWEEATLEFINWKTKGTQIKKYKGKRTWTLVRFSPDFTIFKWLKSFAKDNILTKIKEQVYLEKITIIFEDLVNDETFTFTNDEWISKFITNSNEKEISIVNDKGDEQKKKEFTPLTKIIKIENEKVKANNGFNIIVDFAFEFIVENKSIIKSFTNSINNPEWWTHKDSFTSWIFKWIKELLKYQWAEWEALLKDITPKDVLFNILWIVSIKIPDPQFESQTKIKLTSDYIYKEKIIEKIVIREILTKFNNKDVKKIMEIIKLKINSRKKLEKDELKLEALSEKDLQKKLPSKLLDAVNKDRKKTELFIVEWDSAGWNIQTERNPQIHAIMPLRWKLINALKAGSEKSVANQEINNLIYSISWWHIYEDFDIKKHLRYWKIIISADADADGMHIQNLVISFFMKFFYNIIESGNLYIANTPLFSAHYKDDVHYFYTEKDKEEFLKKNGSKYHISRFKWLWEMDSWELANALLNTKFRSLHKVTVKKWEEAREYVEELLIDSQTKFDLIQDYQDTYLEKVENDQLGLKEKTKELIDVVKDNSIEFALEDNLERKIPYIEDGLKNVYRRIIYTLKKDLNSKSNWEFIKSAKIVWNVIGDYHPHWDSSAYEAMVWLIQDFKHNIPLITGHGSYGSIFAPSSFAAYRYTKAKISKFSEDILLNDLYKKPVLFVPNYANTLEEPVILPAKIPVALLLWLNWIWFGMSHQSVPHNIREVIDATIWFLNKKKKEKYDPLKWIKWPDLPTGWIIMNTPKEIQEIYNNPYGWTFKFRLPLELVEYNKETWFLISNVPFWLSDTEKLKDKIRTLIEDNKLFWVKKIIDISWWDKSKKKKWLRLFLTIDKKVKKEFILENLYSKVRYAWVWLEYNISYRPLYVNRFKELKLYTLSQIIENFIEFRRETVTEIYTYDKAKLENEIKNLNNKILFALNIDKIVKIIKNNNTRNIIKKKIIEAFPKNKLTDEDAETIIETKLIQIKDLKVLENDLKKKERDLKKVNDILATPKKLDKVILEDLIELKKTYKNELRKTKFILQKDLKLIEERKKELVKHEKDLALAEILKPNYIYVDEMWFITRETAVQETTIDKYVDKILKEKKEKNIKTLLIVKNNNNWKLFVLSKNNLWFSIPTQKLEWRIMNEPLNRKIPKYKGGNIIWAFYVDLINKNTNLDNIVIYKDKKGNIWGLRIKNFDLAKSKQWFKLFWNWNEIVYFWNNIDEVDLSKIVDIDLKEYSNVRKTIFNKTDFPIKKSLSSWKTILKKK